ncbi:MAG: acetyltransferase [Deinococcota bacterium]
MNRSDDSRLPLYVVGAGGHAKVVIDTLQALGETIAGIVDDNTNALDTVVEGVKVVDTTDLLTQIAARAIIAVGSNRARQRISEKLVSTTWLAAIHPRAYVAPSARIGAGSIVMAGAVIQPQSQLGKHVIVNTCASIDHDCHLNDYVHVAPGCHLAGNVTLERGAFMGVGSCAIPGKHIGAWTTVGAGATVIHDIPPHVTALGTPAHIR